MRKVTSFDVARRAGVSQPTVSRALRNLPGVSRETRDRIRSIAVELSYVPSDRGRALSTQVSRRVAVVAPELDNPYYPQLIEPIRRELARRGLRTVLVTDGGTEPEGDRMLLDDLADGSYDGVILTATRRRSTLPRDLSERGMAHVLVNRVLDVPESPSCAIDNVHGSRLVADLLLDLGHTRIGMVAGPVDTSTGRERADALRSRLRKRGVRLRREHVQRCEFDHDAARAAATVILDTPTPPTAIVCGNDVVALGVLSAARDAGVDVPADLTVIGFDDIPWAGWPLVDLTTVKCDLAELAARSVQMLVAHMHEPEEPAAVDMIIPSIVLRGTHAPWEPGRPG